MNRPDRHWAQLWTSGTTACGLKVTGQGVDGVWLSGTWGYVNCDACRVAEGRGRLCWSVPVVTPEEHAAAVRFDAELVEVAARIIATWEAWA